jgi:type IV pilus assembly protein PilC
VLKKRRSKAKIYFLLSQLYVLLKSGLPLTRALEVTALQKENLKSQLLAIKQAIEEGEPLSEAFKKGGVFPEFLCAMLIAAHTELGLEEVFLKTSQWLMKLEEFRSKLLKALIYPCMVIFLSTIALLIVLKFILPRLEKILTSFGSKLPLITEIMIKGASFLWYALLLGIPLFFLTFFYLKKKKGLDFLHLLALKIPFFGKVWLFFDLGKWAYILGLLLDTGVVLPQAVEIASQNLTNSYLKNAFKNFTPKLAEGKALSLQLKKLSVIPQVLTELLFVGEESGTLPEMCKNASEVLFKELEEKIENFLKWIEPLTVLVLGLVVFYIVVSVILPIMKVSTSLK